MIQHHKSLKQRNGKDRYLCLFKQQLQNHQNAGNNDSKIISSSLKNNTFKWEVAEVFLIRQVKPYLTVQEKSVALDLFN